MIDLATAWQTARDHWAEPILLSPPVDDPKVPLALIDLTDRRVHINLKKIRAHQLDHCIVAILAHEVGHHLRWPKDLATYARLTVVERSLIPLDGFAASNLFTDLLINERLGHTFQAELAAVYRALGPYSVPKAKSDVFTFYLTIYEELWQLPAGALVGPDAATELHARHPAYRAEAHILSETLFQLGPDLHTQFIYFLSILMRYIEADAEQALANLGCQCNAEPTADDWARAIDSDHRVSRALARALREGWLSKDQVDRLGGDNSFERRIASLPGQMTGAADAVPEIMAAWYRLTAEKYLLRPAPQRRWGEAVVPTDVVPWEPGEPLTGIDWTATLSAKGDQLGAAEPLLRSVLADEEGLEHPHWQPRLEVYLDVSGSMPDPRRERNAMTLAAQILVTGTVRAGGWVRALLYSSDMPVKYWDWCRSSTEMSRFLMHYIGAGTDFPFGILADSTEETLRDPPIRVVISDSDFHQNVEEAPARRRAIIARATEHSARFILLAHMLEPEIVATYRRLGATVINIVDLEAFPKVAAELAQALFDREGHARRA